MITASEEDRLADIYFSIRSKVGWLADCVDAGFNSEQIQWLEELDEEMSGYQPEQEANKWAAGIIVDLESEDDEENIKILNKKIDDSYRRIDNLISSSASYANVVIERKALREQEKLRNKIRAKIIQKENPTNDDLSEFEIERARAKPLREIISGDLKYDRLPCPFHEGDDRNFSVKGNFGYCFVCGEWCDAIKWLMKIEGMTFKNAVRRLCA